MELHVEIEKIKQIEFEHLAHYPQLAAHTFRADLRMIEINRSFIKKISMYLKPGGRVLDIGCGTGWLVELFRQAGYESHGGDILPVKLRKERYPLANFHYFDIFAPPPEDAMKYDFIFMRALGPIEKLQSWDNLELFKWIASHLNKNGVLYFIHGSNGSGIPDINRQHQTIDAVLKALKPLESVAPITWRKLPNNMVFICGKPHSCSYSNILSAAGVSGVFYLLKGAPLLSLPCDDVHICLSMKLKPFDWVLMIRSYPLFLVKMFVKGLIKKRL